MMELAFPFVYPEIDSLVQQAFSWAPILPYTILRLERHEKLQILSINQTKEKTQISRNWNVSFSVRSFLILPGKFSHCLFRAPRTVCSAYKITTLPVSHTWLPWSSFRWVFLSQQPGYDWYNPTLEDFCWVLGVGFWCDLTDAFSHSRNKYLLIHSMLCAKLDSS